jgi:hypothetical protein
LITRAGIRSTLTLSQAIAITGASLISWYCGRQTAWSGCLHCKNQYEGAAMLHFSCAFLRTGGHLTQWVCYSSRFIFAEAILTSVTATNCLSRSRCRFAAIGISRIQKSYHAWYWYVPQGTLDEMSPMKRRVIYWTHSGSSVYRKRLHSPNFVTYSSCYRCYYQGSHYEYIIECQSI